MQKRDWAALEYTFLRGCAKHPYLDFYQRSPSHFSHPQQISLLPHNETCASFSNYFAIPQSNCISVITMLL